MGWDYIPLAVIFTLDYDTQRFEPIVWVPNLSTTLSLQEYFRVSPEEILYNRSYSPEPIG